jgi:hypothetical protein
MIRLFRVLDPIDREMLVGLMLFLERTQTHHISLETDEIDDRVGHMNKIIEESLERQQGERTIML